MLDKDRDFKCKTLKRIHYENYYSVRKPVECGNEVGSNRKPRDSNDQGADVDKSDTRNKDAEVRIDLPEDLLRHIFSLLDQKDLCNAGATCKQWQETSMHVDFWKFLCLQKTKISPSNFDAICRKYPNANGMSLFRVHDSDVLARSAMHSLRNLETLIFVEGKLSGDFFKSLKFCPVLKSLTICAASFGHEMQVMHVFQRTLQELLIVNCDVHSVIISCRQLQSLSLRHTRMTRALLSCPGVYALDLSSCNKLSAAGILSAATSCPLLASLDISSCSCVDDETLHGIALGCPNLYILNASYCPNISLESIKLAKLVDLKLDSCEGLTSASVSTIFQARMPEAEAFNGAVGCPMLTSLVLDNCKGLTMVSLRSSSLASLSIVGCRGMTVLELSCPKLWKINVDACDHLEKASFCLASLESLNLPVCPKLRILKVDAPKMSVLELKGLGVLSEVSINCPYLKALDASFCREFMDDSLFTTAASCPHIESLILPYCLSLGFAGFSSLQYLQCLTFLDLSYTKLMDLQPVFRSCLRLVILKLVACKYLTSWSLDPLYKQGALPALRELDLSHSSIGQPAISELVASSTNLVRVNLNGCEDLNNLLWGPGYSHSLEASSSNFVSKNGNGTLRNSECLLEILSCVGCPNVEKVFIMPIARCFHLSRLNLSLSKRLQEVDITCINLSSLDLSKCSSLEILKLDCPRLMHLHLLGCTMLVEEAIEDAISRCDLLETLNVEPCPNLSWRYVKRLRMSKLASRNI